MSTGPCTYYLTNAIPSLINYWTTGGGDEHRYFWSEKAADELAPESFEKPEIWPTFSK